MLRRTSVSLFRRTERRLAGDGGLKKPLYGKDAPSADECKGLHFGTWNGDMKMLRFVDPKWILNRFVALQRDAYVATPVFYFYNWFFFWGSHQTILWSEGQPPRDVDWNKETAGTLPKTLQAAV